MGPDGRRSALVVDDDADVRYVLTALLESEGYAVRGAGDPASADRAVESTEPDVAIIDLRLGGGREGLTLTRRLRDGSHAGVVVLSAADDVEDKLAAFAHGADDYVTKPFDARELVARVDAVARRRRPSAPTLELGDLVVDAAAHTVDRDGHPIEVTKIEFDLLVVLLRRPGIVMPKTELLARVWGFDGLDPNVVEVHVSALRRKLEAHGPRLIHTVRGVGYVARR